MNAHTHPCNSTPAADIGAEKTPLPSPYQFEPHKMDKTLVEYLQSVGEANVCLEREQQQAPAVAGGSESLRAAEINANNSREPPPAPSHVHHPRSLADSAAADDGPGGGAAAAHACLCKVRHPQQVPPLQARLLLPRRSVHKVRSHLPQALHRGSPGGCLRLCCDGGGGYGSSSSLPTSLYCVVAAMQAQRLARHSRRPFHQCLCQPAYCAGLRQAKVT